MGLRNALQGERRVQKELDTVRRDLNRLRGDMGDVVGALRERSRRNLGQMREGVSDELTDKLNALNRRYANARRFGQRWCRDTSRRARAHPWATALITLGIGAAITSVFASACRRRR